MKITKLEIKQLEEALYFRVSEKQLDELEKEFIEISNKMDQLKSIDTDNIIPMIFPLVDFCNVLREDVIEVSDSDEVLSNSKDRFGRYVVVE